MNFNINDVAGGVVSKFSFGMLACLITTYGVSNAFHHGERTIGSWVILSVMGIILLGWLIWFFYMYLSDKRVVPVHRKSGQVVEVVNFILFAIWIFSEYFWRANLLWVIVAWSLYAFSVIYYSVYCHKNANDA